MHHRLWILGAVLLFSMGAVLFSSWLKESILSKSNGFQRYLIFDFVKSQQVVNIDARSYYLAGSYHDTIIIAGNHLTNHILNVNVHSGNLRRISISSEDKVLLNASRVVVDSNYFYVGDGRTTYWGSTSDWKLYGKVNHGTFSSMQVPIGWNSFIRRTVVDRYNVLEKECVNVKTVKIEKGLLEAQIDGFFCTDGMLLFNGVDKVVYVYFYRNQFICADTNLNLLYRSRTIDTTSVAPLKVAFLNKGKTVTLATPPYYVNKICSTYRDFLLIHSNRISENESRILFKKMPVFDLYDLRNGKYCFSFYAFIPKDEQLLDFSMIDDKLVMLSRHYITLCTVDIGRLNK